MQRRFIVIMVLLVGLVVPAQAQERVAEPASPASVASHVHAPGTPPHSHELHGELVEAQVGGQVNPRGPCGELLEIVSGSDTFCTHGTDTPPEGARISDEPTPVATSDADINSVICAGDGTSGYRVHVMYVRASDRPDRFSQYLGSMRTWSSNMDNLFNASAQETGGNRHVRFVTNANCQITVANVVIPANGDDSFNATINAVKAKGYNRTDRRYLMFVDANLLCGVGTLYLDDQAGQTNANNGNYTSYARVDAGCWGANVAAHELMHTLGAVQRSAPHSTAYGHCWDDGDIMCYNDGAGTVIKQVCATSHENRFDCKHDDYYHTNPAAGSYLATHWNTARSRFLIKGTGTADGEE